MHIRILVLKRFFLWFLQTLIGTDIADLLLEGHEPASRSYSRGPGGPFIEAETEKQPTRETVSADRTVINKEAMSADGSSVELTDRFRHLLLHGRKKVNLRILWKNSC